MIADIKGIIKVLLIFKCYTELKVKVYLKNYY